MQSERRAISSRGPWPEDPKADPKTGASYFVSDLYLRIESVRAEDGRGCGYGDTERLGPAHYSGCIPAFWMASCHKVRSERRKRCTSSRVPPPLKTPFLRKSSLTSVRARMSFRSLFTRASASYGVPVGASNANHPTAANPGTASATVGIFSKPGRRSLE